MTTSLRPPHARLPVAPLPSADARWALLLDVDGSLLDFMADPRTVVASASLCQLLDDLHHAVNGALALVSGRTMDDIDRIFGHPDWAAVGLHGMESRQADGSVRHAPVNADHRARMRQAVRQLAARFPGVEIEDKQHAIALHCRNDPGQLAALRAAAEALLPQLTGYELQPGRQVIEIRPVGMNKGDAVDELLERPPFAGRTPVYVGDDLTDEHAFARVNRCHGISVRVGSREPSLARFTLGDPAATQCWLASVLRAIQHGDPARG